MNSYMIPREIGDENRFLIFSPKALLFVVIGIIIGGLLATPLFILASLWEWCNYVGFVIIMIFAVVAYCLGTFKIPDSNAFAILKIAGGENVDTIVKRIINFRKNRKIYIYKGGSK